MSNLRFEIYPAATPTSGLLATFNSDDYEEGTELRQELNGDGAGRIVVHAAHPDVTAANFAKGNYVKVIDLDLGVGEAVGGFWLSEGDFVAVSRKEVAGRVLTFGGPGSLAYLSRAAMLNAPYVASGSGVYNGPRDDNLWHWGVANTIGSVLKRILDEAQDSDRPTDPIPALTYDFDNDDDSAGDPWDNFTGSFTLPVGENYLGAIETFMQLGLTILMKPTLELNAYQEEFGTDRSSATFAAGKVRFKHGTNIVVGQAGDLRQGIHETPRLKLLLVAGEGATPATMVQVIDAGAPIEKEGYLSYANGSVDGVATLTDAGERDLALRAAQTSTAILTLKPGATPLTGFYTPGWPGGAGHFWLGDIVTLDSVPPGASAAAYDFVEAALRVAAIHYKLRAGGDWEIVVELGATYYSVSQPSIAGGGGGGVGCSCPHPPSNPYESGTPAVSDWLWTFDASGFETTGVYGQCGGWHPGYVHSHVTSPGVGNFSATPRAPVSPGTYHARGVIARNNGTPYNPGGIALEVYYHDGSGLHLAWTSGLVTSYAPTEVAADVVFPAGTDSFVFSVPFNSSTIFEFELSHGGGADTFEGDDPPPGASDAVGSIGTDVGCYALCDHRHAAQTAAVTPIGDAGGYFDGATVEEALQELGGGISGGIAWFNVKSYGAVGDGATDDTAEINAAIAALNAAGQGVLYFPASTGHYVISDALTTITAKALVMGDGMSTAFGGSGPSIIQITANNKAVFTVSGHPVKFKDLGLNCGSVSTPTTGSIGIKFATAIAEAHFILDSVSIRRFHIGIDIQTSAYSVIDKCVVSESVKYDLKIQNTVDDDHGDMSISNSSFLSRTYTPDAHIRIESSGGIKIVNCKLNWYDHLDTLAVHGIDLAIPTGVITGILLIANTSIENVSGDAIHGTTAGTGLWGGVTLSNVQVGLWTNNTGYALNLVGASAGKFTDVSLVGCRFHTDGTARTAVQLTNVARAHIGPVVLDGFNKVVDTTTSTGIRDATGSVGNEVAISGVPSVGQVPTATSGTAATWQTPATPPAAGSGDHAHVVDEQFSGDAATTVFALANEAQPDTVMAYVSGTRTPVTLGGTFNDEITFGSAPASGTNNISVDYAAALT
jgi:hypothetical protein